MIKKFTLLLFGLILLHSFAAAAVKWDPKEGWKTEGGLTDLIWHDTSDAKTGIQSMEKGRQAEEAGEYMKALSYYKKVHTLYPQSNLAPQALYQEANIRIVRHQYEDAFLLYEKIITQYPDYPNFDAVIRQQFQIATYLKQGNRPYYWGIIPGFRDYDSAVKYYENIVSNAPFDDLAPQALMNIAVLSEQHEKTDKTIDALDRLISDYPNNPITPKAYLLLAQAHLSMVYGPQYDQGSTREALGYYQDFITLFPGNPDIPEAEEGIQKCHEMLSKSKLELGDFYYYYRNNNKAALAYYNEAISVNPNTPAAYKAQEQIQKIKDHVIAPKTPVDWIFGRYENPAENEEDTL